ncbi:MAG: 2,3-bisphosphoglycerate-independent phosphoglycerate mutase [Gemmiger sp.]
MAKKPVVLCIMDGFGWTPDQTFGNAVAAANKPNLDTFFTTSPMTTIDASGMAVGLPDGQMGNSEVGHTNMGAGRIVYQQLTLITKSIRDGSMRRNPVLVKNMQAAIDAGKAIHLMGLVGNGGVHSHVDHWFGVLEMAKAMGAGKVYLHCIMDGRDTDPHDGKTFLGDLQAKLDELGIGTIATVTGRYYAMDRDSNWDREEKAYAAFVYGEGNKAANWQEAIDASYAADVTDEFVVPVITCEGGRVTEGDTVIFMNFRPDRARQMTRIFVDDEFKGFERRYGRFPVNYVCMAEYDATMPNVEVAYPPVELTNVLGEYLSKNGKTQLRIAETEKYAHVTFFFNGGVEAPYEGEDRKVIPSPKVATYDLQPEMSAPAVADECVARIESGKYDVVILNFANCDMVGHTGVYEAAVKAVEAVDAAVGKVVDAALKMGGVVFITADHGNAEKMMNPDGSPFTAHTTNLVPFAVVGAGDVKLREGGCLADIAPTMLPFIGLPVPAEMTGKSIIVD